MKSFEPCQFDRKIYERELLEFEQLLINNNTLEENKQILPFFRQHPQLVAQTGTLATKINSADSIAYEFDLFDYRCDAVVGDLDSKHFCFIEFEDANNDSIFKSKQGKFKKEFAPRFEHGYSQIIDWLQELYHQRGNATKMIERFGHFQIGYSACLVIGRDAFLDESDKIRFNWRSDYVKIDSKEVLVLTYDELLRFLKIRQSQIFPS